MALQENAMLLMLSAALAFTGMRERERENERRPEERKKEGGRERLFQKILE